MALTPFVPKKIAPVAVGSSLVLPSGTVSEGKPTSYFQRWLQDLLANLNGTFGDLAGIIQELEDQQAEIDAAVLALQEFSTLVGETFIVVINQLDALTNSGATGYTTVSPSSGTATIAHGLPGAPGLDKCSAQMTGTPAVFVNLISVDASNLTIYLQDNLGIPISGGSYGISWQIAATLPAFPP